MGLENILQINVNQIIELFSLFFNISSNLVNNIKIMLR